MTDNALPHPQRTVDHLVELYETHGHADYIGEPVPQLAHMWQAAALAEAEGSDDDVVLVAFFHDLGHLCATAEAPSMAGLGAVNHERLGADYPRARSFSERVARLVASHVLAKRYLTHKYPEYLRQLSEASRATLLQGRAMTAAEAADFEQHPDADIIIRMRQWDDRAKQAGLPVRSPAKLKALALWHLLRQSR